MMPILAILALVCDPDPIWEQARQMALAECHTMKQIWGQLDDCAKADTQLEHEGFYCAPILGEVREGL